LPKKICIDGFNIAMRRGSGIATYARNLNLSLHRMGFQTQVLYGPPYGRNSVPLLNEINLVNGGKPSASVLARFSNGCRAYLGPAARAVRPVVRTGFVDTRQIEPNLPKSDVIWAARDLFHRANSKFGAFGRFTSVRFRGDGLSPDIAHWTCPLPVRRAAPPTSTPSTTWCR
jgi:hypothetical protein